MHSNNLTCHDLIIDLLSVNLASATKVSLPLFFSLLKRSTKWIFGKRKNGSVTSVAKLSHNSCNNDLHHKKKRSLAEISDSSTAFHEEKSKSNECDCLKALKETGQFHKVD